MSLQNMFKRIASAKARALKGSNYDEINISEELRGAPANSVYKRIQRAFRRVVRDEYDLVQDTDGNVQAALEVGDLNFLAKAKSSLGNLITLTIVKDASVVLAVNEEQLIEFDTVPDAGEWTLEFDGEETGTLNFDADASAIQAALNALPNLSGVTVSGDYTLGFTVVFAGADGGKDQPLLVEASNTLETLSAAVSITISEDVGGVEGEDTRSVSVSGYHVEVHCISTATNTQLKAQLDASPAAALFSTTIDAGQGAAQADAVVSAQFSGGL